jgi:hypothetical protein
MAAFTLPDFGYWTAETSLYGMDYLAQYHFAKDWSTTCKYHALHAEPITVIIHTLQDRRSPETPVLPSEQQIAALRQFLKHGESLYLKILVAMQADCFTELMEHGIKYRVDHGSEIDGLKELETFATSVTPASFSVLPESSRHPLTMGLHFTADLWEIEHGIGALFTETSDIRFGTGDVVEYQILLEQHSEGDPLSE